MEIKNKNVFWESLILAILIFASGVFLGYLLELNRTSKIISLYQQLELDVLDSTVRDNLFSVDTIDCDKLFQETIDFADRIYEEAKLLERYSDSNKLSSAMNLQHKKYDLLRTQLWIHSMKLKVICGADATILVYFYEYETQDINLKSKQSVFSKKLAEIKDKYANKIILIPIAGNMELNSIDYLKNLYGVDSYPTILINQKVKIQTIEELNDMDTYFS